MKTRQWLFLGATVALSAAFGLALGAAYFDLPWLFAGSICLAVASSQFYTLLMLQIHMENHH